MFGMVDRGVSDASRVVNLAVALRYRNAGELETLVAAQADPANARFRRFLTSDEFAARYAPSVADHERVRAALQRAGFAISQTFAHRSVILASAPAPAVARMFATELREADQPGGGRHYGNVTEARIPSDLADVVSGVAGLSDAPAFQTFIRRNTQAVAPNAAGLAARVLGPDGGYGPSVYATAYNLSGQPGATGRGRAGAIVIDGDFLDSDIATYLQFFGLKRGGQTFRVKVQGGPPPGLNLSSAETTLDVETMLAQAPDADLYVYEGRNFNNPANLVATYAALVADNKVDLVNASLGYCETAFGTFPQMVEQLALQGSALGITFHASTGDAGKFVFGCNRGVNVAAPAIAPHVVAVGGTDLKADTRTGAFRGEVAWNDGPQFGATGGGVSKLFALPAFQSTVRGIAAQGRNSPDISFTADPSDGTAFYYQGVWQGPLGGTSLASPLFGGALLQLNEQRGGRSGYITPTLYSVWQRVGYSGGGVNYFRDITSTSRLRSISPGNTVGQGYDRLTGIGPVLFQGAGPLLRQ